MNDASLDYDYEQIFCSFCFKRDHVIDECPLEWQRQAYIILKEQGHDVYFDQNGLYGYTEINK